MLGFSDWNMISNIYIVINKLYSYIFRLKMIFNVRLIDLLGDKTDFDQSKKTNII